MPAVSGNVGRVAPKVTAVVSRLSDTRSPLRYPGGKTRAVSTICSLIPPNVKKLCAPFLGGASIELACAANGIKIFGSDAYEPVINFWQQALNNPGELADLVKQRYFPLSRTQFYNLQRIYRTLEGELEKAAAFYTLNRSSFSGVTLSGGMSPGHPRFTESAIERLRNFRSSNLRVRCADYKDALARHGDKFLYLDPPYANGGRLYGTKGDMHEGFNHEELADVLRQRDGWILSYNNCAEIRKLYKGFKQEEPEWTYGMSDDKQSSELLVINV